MTESTTSQETPAIVEPASSGAPVVDPAVRKRSRVAMLKYGLARLGLFLVITALIQLLVVAVNAPVPLLFSALLALFVSLPLSMLLFRKWRIEAVEAVAAASAQRKAQKAWVQQELAGR